MSQGLLHGHGHQAIHRQDAALEGAGPELPATGAARRRFLKIGASIGVSAAAGGGMLLSFAIPAKAADLAQAEMDASPNAAFAPNGFIRIDNTGLVTLIMPKVEMGQGTYTSLPMLLAEELEVSLDKVQLEHAPPDEKLYTDPLLGGQLTGGSTSVRYAWDPMRQAGALGRTLLVSAAAAQWQVDPASCKTANGEVIHPASDRRAGYGSLVDAAAKLPAPASVPLKDPKDFKLIGTPVKRLDSPDKVNGVAQFGLDVRLPGMVYAVVASCPVVGGTVASVDDSVTKTLPGVHQVVKLDNAVAVIGDHTWAANRGLAALKIEWNEGSNARLSNADLVADLAAAAQHTGAVARNDGDAGKMLQGAAKKVDAIYQQPFLAHATMEPMNCTVHLSDGNCDIWVGTQVPTRVRDAAMQVTGLPADKIRVHNFLIGGGFGRRLEVDGVTQAVKIAQQVNAPVKLLWTREQDIQHDMYRPYYYDSISAGLDANGKPVAWTHRIVGSSIMARFFPPAFKNGLDPDAVEVASDPPYDLPNIHVDYVRQEPRGIATAFWRGVGPTRGTFVVESFIDELAAVAKVDPVQYRLDLLDKTPRAKNVLQVATQQAGWGTAPTELTGYKSGRGVSVMHAFGSFLAMVADVAVNPQGEVKVRRVVCAVDCGMIVNPDTIAAQIEGGINFGVTAALYSEITFKDGRVEQNNFTDYRMLRIDEAPLIEVHLVKSTEAPGGIGETGTAALAPAVTNAIFAATGKRLRQLPVGTQLQAV
ncbi:xanthine dehydrogenase family protein molybdopterin-binding subunit [Burkholderia sp. L27(2015)]|uniref:xanthine dehydrogenase family protein molybdopterin-binding subunit n=1 Tax=Burkholderia sp. L27(2015) TaxID=1641858 RepID=UPI00131D99F8|nr:xanthine dehydrogenase family protein molybdopterin-binding subunit [Burkholderia sp. L27(2015)]